MKKFVLALACVSALSFADVNVSVGNFVRVNTYPTYPYPRPVYPVPVYPVVPVTPVYPVVPVAPLVPVVPAPQCYTVAVPVQGWKQVWTLLQGWVWKLETTWQYQVVCR